MRRLLKFFHTLGAAGLLGGMAAFAVIIVLGAGPGGAAGDAGSIRAMAEIAAWIIGPSMLVTIIAGLLAIAVHPPFHDAGWVWAKAATGILIFEGGLHVMGPIQEQARRSAGALANAVDPVSVTRMLEGERNTLWMLLAVSAANIALGVWRPRLLRVSD